MSRFTVVRSIYVLVLIPLLLLCRTAGLSWAWVLALTIVYGGILALGAAFIQLRFFVPSRISGPAAGNCIALSFDDGPADYTADILDILQLENVPAGFFAIGHRVIADPETVRRWDAEGHLIGNHSFSHSFNFDWKTARAMQEELVATNAAIEAACGRKPLLFRPPYGVTNPALAKAVCRTGMISVGWSLRSLDTRAKDPQALVRRITDRVKPGDVILLHDSMQITATVLTAVIQACRQKGFTFVRPDELLRLQAYA